MKLIKSSTLIFLNLFISYSNGQLYTGVGLSIANYFGEVGYNDYLVFLPLSTTTMPGVDIAIGNRTKYDFRTEFNLNYNPFRGNNEFTTVPSLQKYSNAKLNGHLLRFGATFFTPESGQRYFLGASIQYYKSFYESNFKLIPDGLQSSDGQVLELVIGRRLKKGRFRDLLELRYSILFSSNDDFDGLSLGNWNDHLTKLSICYTIPNSFIKYKYKTRKLIKKSRRHRTQCPSF